MAFLNGNDPVGKARAWATAKEAEQAAEIERLKAEIDAWTAATGLNEGAGDPDGSTPDPLEWGKTLLKAENKARKRVLDRSSYIIAPCDNCGHLIFDPPGSSSLMCEACARQSKENSNE